MSALSSIHVCKGELSTVIAQLIQGFPNGPQGCNPCNSDFFALAKYANKHKLLEIPVQFSKIQVFLKVLYAKQKLPLLYVDANMSVVVTKPHSEF